jgi:diguanylate cyclase (GGDEF)-like protein/PAS domain S-box-containing protein
MNNLSDNILRKINAGILIFDEERIITYWNGWLEQYSGIAASQAIGQKVQKVIPAFRKNYYRQLFCQTFEMEQSMFCSGGLHPVFVDPVAAIDRAIVKQNLQIDVVFIDAKKHILIQLFDTTNQFKRVETLKREIANRKKIEQLLFAEKEQLKTTLLSVGDGVISTDKYGEVLIINKAAEKLTGWTQAEAAGQPLEVVFNTFDEVTGKKSACPFNRVFASDHSIETVDSVILRARNQTEIMIEDSVSPIRDRWGQIDGMVLVFRDVTEKKQKQAEIEYLSLHDQLTGLYNRRFFDEELARLDCRRNWPLSVILGDINGLKLINDAFGHVVGDELIKKGATAIRQGCREDDIVCRIGGDEFVILLPKTDASEAETIIARIKQSASEKKVETLDVSISFGAATKTSAADATLAVIKTADERMYHNKLFESQEMRKKTVNRILKSIFQKDWWEEDHAHGVSQLCQNMGEILGLPKKNIGRLKTAGLLHDIGKIAVGEAILNKPGKLTQEEWQQIIRHSEIGYRILSAADDLSEIAEYVLNHHESWNGKGYPKGLSGEEIPLESRILNIADAYDAMISDRSYRKALSAKEALAELQKNAGTQFDPELVKVFISALYFRA